MSNTLLLSLFSNHTMRYLASFKNTRTEISVGGQLHVPPGRPYNTYLGQWPVSIWPFARSFDVWSKIESAGKLVYEHIFFSFYSSAQWFKCYCVGIQDMKPNNTSSYFCKVWSAKLIDEKQMFKILVFIYNIIIYQINMQWFFFVNCR